MKKLLAATLFFALSTAAALAADFNGKWTAEVPSRQGGTTTTTFTFKVDSGKVTGTMSNQMGDMEITNGKADGDTISFDVIRTFNDNKMTLTYLKPAKADGAGGVKFTRTMSGMAGGGGGQAPPPQEFHGEESGELDAICAGSSATLIPRNSMPVPCVCFMRGMRHGLFRQSRFIFASKRRVFRMSVRQASPDDVELRGVMSRTPETSPPQKLLMARSKRRQEPARKVV